MKLIYNPFLYIYIFLYLASTSVTYKIKPKSIFCNNCSPCHETRLACSICSKKLLSKEFGKSQRGNTEPCCIECNRKREKEDVYDFNPDTESEDEFGQCL
ncbi:hypothetical protein EDC94DRAFT_512689 [Helicostylum pulchrum]|nr:hypothetical protein EDC94DRAFT_512689 [Helicostylum pulchrum]